MHLNWLKHTWLAAAIAGTMAGTASGLVVSGTIKDSSGAVVPDLYVKVMDYDPLNYDDVIAEVTTNASGVYTTSLVESGHDVYLLVEYKKDLNATYAAGHTVQGCSSNSSGQPSSPGDVVQFETSNMTSGYLPGISANGTINIPTTASGSALNRNYIIAIDQVRATFTYLATQGVTGFSFPHDLKVTHLSNAANNDAAYSTGGHLFLGNNYLTNSYTISHETGHCIHYRARGNTWPPTSYPGSAHSRNSESDEGFALTEGWAEALGDLAGSPRVTPAHAWRGSTANNLNGNTGSGSDNNGEIVEGALCEIMKGATFRYWAEGVLTPWPAGGSHPDVFRSVWRNYVTRCSYAAATVNPTFPLMRRYGVLWNRAKISLPDAAPNTTPATFNVRRITQGGAVQLFVRGVLKPTPTALNTTELRMPPGSTPTFPINDIRYGTKTTAAGTNENNSYPANPNATFGNFTWHTAAGWTTANVDTTTLADGNYDLIIKVTNGWDQWEDDFDPTWYGDPTAAYSTDEKWLQHQQTWYAEDLDANSTITDAERRIVVDNVAPQVNSPKPQ